MTPSGPGRFGGTKVRRWERALQPVPRSTARVRTRTLSSGGRAPQLFRGTHTLSVLSGRLRIQMRDGQALALAPGDIAFIPPGHEACWVVGDEPFRVVDFTGAEDYAQSGAGRAEPPPLQ